MHIGLRDGVTFAWVNGRSVFLDVHRGRYFAISPELDREFRTVLESSGKCDVSEALAERLCRAGIARLQPDPGATLAPLALKIPPISAADLRIGWPGLRGACAAVSSHLYAGVFLKSASLVDVVESVRGARSRLSRAPTRWHADDRQIASAFAWSNRLFSSNERCLQRSLGAIWLLLARGIEANLVFGVRLNPFLAHSWVQTPAQLVTDDCEHVRTFTPILVL